MELKHDTSQIIKEKEEAFSTCCRLGFPENSKMMQREGHAAIFQIGKENEEVVEDSTQLGENFPKIHNEKEDSNFSGSTVKYCLERKGEY